MCACLFQPFASLFGGRLDEDEVPDPASLDAPGPDHTEGLTADDVTLTSDNPTAQALAATVLSPTNAAAAPPRRNWRGAEIKSPRSGQSIPKEFSRSDSSDKRIEQALEEQLAKDAEKEKARQVELSMRVRYKCIKMGRHGHRTTRWLSILRSPSSGSPDTLVLYKQAPGKEVEADTRESKLGNVRPKLVKGGREVIVDFLDHSTSSLSILGIDGGGGERIILPRPESAKSSTPIVAPEDLDALPAGQTEYLEDLMYQLTQGFYRPHQVAAEVASAHSSVHSSAHSSAGRASPTGDIHSLHNPTREVRRQSVEMQHPATEILSDLESTVADALFVSMQNYTERLSSDGTEWEELISRHIGMDGTRVWKSASYNPRVPRFKCVTHIAVPVAKAWEAFTNPVLRPAWDKKIFKFNVLREWPLPDAENYGGQALIQLLLYSCSPKSTGACAGREFFEIRVLLPATSADDTAKIVTLQIRQDQESKYRTTTTAHQTGLGATHHEHCFFFKPFKNGTMTRLTNITKISLTGNILAGSASAMLQDKVGEHAAKVVSALKKGLETEGQLFLPEWDAKMSKREPSFEAKLRAPSSPRATTIAGVQTYSATVEKGPPGVGFGLLVEMIGDKIVVDEVLVDSVKYHKWDTGTEGERIWIEKGDVIAECSGEELGEGIQKLVQCLRRVRIGGGVDMVLERGHKLGGAVVERRGSVQRKNSERL